MAGTGLALVGACLFLLAIGNGLRDPAHSGADPVELSLAPPPAPAVEPEPDAVPQRPSRRIAPKVVAPPPLDEGGLERMPARGPLSPLSLALPPKPKPPDQQEGTTLFNMVATAAGMLEGQSGAIRIAGIEPVDPARTCGDGAAQWPCGARARSAFRAFLRGRAVTCQIPPQAGAEGTTARCRIGNQDLGGWLVENGWAPALPDGPFAEQGVLAREQGKGLFGRAPDLSAPDAPSASSTLPSPSDG